MTAPQPLTAARRAEIRARHKDTRRILPGCECSVCLAPADIAALLAEVERLRAALRYYALPEHWMALTSDPDSPRVVWVARTHLDSSADGYSTARAALAAAGTGGSARDDFDATEHEVALDRARRLAAGFGTGGSDAS